MGEIYNPKEWKCIIKKLCDDVFEADWFIMTHCLEHGFHRNHGTDTYTVYEWVRI